MHLLEKFPETELFIVWVDIFNADDLAGARESAVIPAGPRVTQFHDGQRRAARALAPIMGLPSMLQVAQHAGTPLERLARNLDSDYLHGAPAAYDTVFFFDGDAHWGEAPPEPRDWITQLVPAFHVGLDPQRSFWEFDFYAELERRAARCFGTEPAAPR